MKKSITSALKRRFYFMSIAFFVASGTTVLIRPFQNLELYKTFQSFNNARISPLAAERFNCQRQIQKNVVPRVFIPALQCSRQLSRLQNFPSKNVQTVWRNGESIALELVVGR